MAVAAVFAIAAAPASAAAPPAWADEANAIAAPWPGLQEASGRFQDYVLRRDPNELRDDYGDAMLGYALLLSAARSGDATLADSGLRALEYALERAARSPSTQVFHQLATVSAYNLARTRFPDHPVFQRARDRWEDVLRRIEVYRLGRQKVTNKSIVESILLLELLRSGLTSNVSGAALADPAATRAAVLRLLSSDLPKAARPYGGVFGDMPLLPPAYHALAVGMLARTAELLGGDTPAEARSLLRKGVQMLQRTAAPDGDVAFHGRSQLQAWTLTLAAYGADRISRRGLADLMIRRLTSGYESGPEGFLVTPSLAQDVDAALPGLDEYLAGASYVGLTLMALEWAIASPGDGRSASDRSAGVVGRGSGSWATANDGRVWYAVKRTRTSKFDLRYDFGLVAMKLREDGVWRDALPARPRTTRGADSAGPVLVSDGQKGFPEGTNISVDGARVVVTGGFRTNGGRWLRRGVRFAFTPTGCGVKLTVNARAGDVFEYSGFFRGTPGASGRTIQDETQLLRFDRPPSSVRYRGEYASGSDAGLTRATARARTRSVTVCGR